jgi:hypothetical protein
MSSGAGFGVGAGAPNCFRAFPVVDFTFPIAFEFGSACVTGGGRGGALRGGEEAGPGGGEAEGSGEGGDKDVISTDGERGRVGES